MAHKELNLRERRAIEDMLNAKMSVGEIAAEIGRHRSTVYREIKRNYYNDEEIPYLNGYYGVNAQDYATDRRARRRKLVRLDGLRKAVITQLKEGWSPEQIAGRLQFEGHPINPENLRATCQTVVRNEGRIIRVSHVALCFRLIDPSMNGLTTLTPARRLANGRAI